MCAQATCLQATGLPAPGAKKQLQHGAQARGQILRWSCEEQYEHILKRTRRPLLGPPNLGLYLHASSFSSWWISAQQSPLLHGSHNNNFCTPSAPNHRHATKASPICTHNQILINPLKPITRNGNAKARRPAIRRFGGPLTYKCVLLIHPRRSCGIPLPHTNAPPA